MIDVTRNMFVRFVEIKVAIFIKLLTSDVQVFRSWLGSKYRIFFDTLILDNLSFKKNNNKKQKHANLANLSLYKVILLIIY